MRVGLIANPSAGNSARHLTSLLQEAETSWSGHRFLLPDNVGADLFPGAQRISTGNLGYVERIFSLVRQMMDAGVDLFVSIGGDGTAAYLAEALVAYQAQVPIFGIGLGTANVGPIVTCRLGEPLPALEQLTFSSVGCVAGYQNGKRIAGGYNDLILGNTYLATKNGNTITASADALVTRGEVVEEAALSQIFTPDTLITKNGQPCPFRLPQVSQAVLSTLERQNYYGRAIDGILCYSSDAPEQAAVTLSGRALVAFTDDGRGYDAFAPEDRLLFGEADTIRMDHLLPGVHLIADGNPYALSNAPVEFHYHPSEILVARR